MNISLPFIKRPVMTTLVMFAILLAGLMGYRLLPVSDLPNVDFPTISVSASLPGASPETMASSVATPLEREFTTIPGIDSMVSSSSKGNTQITLQFALDRNIDAAAQDVQAAISKTLGRLPNDMPSPPNFRKVNPAETPILFLALTSENLPLSEVTEYATTFIAQRISMVQGVAQVSVRGSQKYAVRVQLDPSTLAARSIGVDEVADAIRSANVNMATGDLEGAHRNYTIETRGQLLRAEDYRSIIVAYRNGIPVRLEGLGRVANSVEDDQTIGWYNRTPSVMLTVQKQPGVNTIEVVDSVLEMLPEFRAQIPPAIDLRVMFDRSKSIRESVHEVKFTLWLTIVLVVLVIFAFLRNFSATIIPSLALPMSLIGTFAVMYLLDYSVDNISLMALTLCVGFVVDDAIVVLENIVRHMERGETPMEAAIKGTQEIGFTIVSMTLSLAAVFLPVLFMGGILGRLLEEFAVVIAVAILISGFISLTLTPMLCSRFLRPHHNEKHGVIFNAFERFFDGMLHVYDVTLKLTLRHRLSMVVIFLAVLAGTVWLFQHIPKGLFPSEDTGRMMVNVQAAQGTSFEVMRERQREVGEVLLADPAIDSISNSAEGDSTGRVFAALKPYGEREHSDAIVARLRPKLNEIPGISAIIQIPPTIRIGGRLSRSLFQYTLQSPDTETLYANAPLLQERLEADPMFMDVDTDMKLDNPQVTVTVDRAKASTLGLSIRQIEDALASSYSSRRVSTIFAANNTYDVIMELDPRHQRDPEALDDLYVRSDQGRLVPLSTIARIESGVGPLSVNHQGQLPSVTLSFNLAPGVALGDAVERVEALARESLPGSITTSFQGTAQVFQDSIKGLGLLLLLSILVIYIVLGILYESFIHPITILSGLPSAGFGALGILWLAGMDLNLYSFVGIIMLVGIVKKNAIMMIDFALEEQKKGPEITPMEAIYRGCLVRFRPIMMTTMAALMGAIPIAIGVGAGMESRRPLGMAIVGGLLFSQFLTLYITPVFYTYFEAMRENFARRKARRRARHQASREPAPSPAP